MRDKVVFVFVFAFVFAFAFAFVFVSGSGVGVSVGVLLIGLVELPVLGRVLGVWEGGEVLVVDDGRLPIKR